MTTTTTNREAEDYLDAVRRALADLPEEERGELLEDLAQHLTDIAADESRADVPLTDLLGAPADYASELRTAAGLPSKDTRRRMKVARPDLRAWLNDSALGRWMNGPTGQRYVQPIRSLLIDLKPAWWVARGVVAVVGFFVLASGNAYEHVPVPRVLGSRLLGLVLIGAAIAFSVRLGRRGYGGRKRLMVAADVLLALVALSLVLDASVRLGSTGFGNGVVYVDSGADQHALTSPHGPVTNIYPYDAQGNPLENVLLFDQDGRPLRAAHQEWWPDGCRRAPLHPRAADGVPVEFAYPYRYGVVERSPEELRYEQMRRMFEEQGGTAAGQDGATSLEDAAELSAFPGCAAEIPRPLVPLPTFPPDVTAEAEPETEAETQPEDDPQTTP